MLCIVAENYIMSNMAMIINTTYQEPNHGSGVMAVLTVKKISLL